MSARDEDRHEEEEREAIERMEGEGGSSRPMEIPEDKDDGK